MKENKTTKAPTKYSVKYAAKKHRFVLLTLIITFVVIIALAYYCVGVVELNSMNEIMDVRLDNLSEAVDENSSERELIYNQIISDSEYRAKAIAVMISQNPRIIEDEIGLEELLAVTGIDEITITDGEGKIVKTTGASFESEVGLEEELLAHVSESNYSGTIESERNGKRVLISGVSRRDADGMLSIVYSAETLREIDTYTDISDVTSRFPLMKDGITAIVDIETSTYVSHTDVDYIGKAIELPADIFSDERGSMFEKLREENCYIKYEREGDTVILAAVPESEVYDGRNRVVRWLLFTSIICCFAAALASRKVFLDKQNREKN